MFRLMEVLLYTPDVARMREFYERVIGLSYRTASASWTAYETGGALLALRPLPSGNAPAVELTFEARDLEGAIRAMKSHGVTPTGEIQMHGWGRLVRLRDPDGNSLAIAQPTHPVEEGTGLTLGVAIAHSREMAAMKAFYHHALGLKLAQDSPGWSEFDTGVTRLALRDTKPPNARAIAFGFRIEDLMDWSEGARSRGLKFTTAPGAEDWGLFSDALDPDGHRVTFFEPSAPPAIEDELAEVFEDDGIPHQIALRSPLRNKNSKAASRVAVKPNYRSDGSKPRRRPSATTQEVASVRGGGSDRARLKPKRTADEKKARGKPAMGRAKKAVRNVMEKKKTSVATSSKKRPIKRAVSRGASRSSGKR